MKKIPFMSSYLLFPICIMLLSLFSLSGCISTLKGEYYLSSKDYDNGIAAFESKVRENPEDASSHYYLGRFLIAKNEYKKANEYFRTAVSLKPDNSDYRFWLGLSYGALKDDTMEKRNYQKAIALNPRNAKAHVYIGHVFFRLKTYDQALESYEKALSLQSTIPSALYNKALILNKLNRIPEAKTAFKAYLKLYIKSPRAMQAVTYLNGMGDFDYRNYLIHRRKIAMKRIEFDPEDSMLTQAAKDTLNRIGRTLKTDSQLTLHILSYQKNNLVLAKQKAKQIKKYLVNQITDLNANQIKISWFAVSEAIKVGKKTYRLDTSTNFFVIKN